ncbi:hypothetical protein PR048_027503 [Dryococelus australis]|uniref:DDE-1 domain-containing protein n=1 Tax=Dryococelus australis TaxID=614101 RepID=A0ABQ9GGQ2_9NEOP|nr:hypothetical protein PR048_027503 [Dryococelus australis]
MRKMLSEAVEEVKSGRKLVYSPSKHYTIPLLTIIDHVKGRWGVKLKSHGRPTVFSFEEEKKMAANFKSMEKYGFGLSRKEVMLLVVEYVNKNKIATPFNNGIPSKDWLFSFMNRDKLFCKDPSKIKVVGAVGVQCSRTTNTLGRENTTVLFACNAAGDKAPPLIIFVGKKIWDHMIAAEDEAYPVTSYAATPNGWMPVILFCDGHSTHVGLEVFEVAREASVTILKILPHSSHLLQPLDLSVMKSLKVRWDATLTSWQRQHIGKKLPKKVFSQLVGKIWEETNPEIITSGFKKAGIYPFDDSIIPEEKFDPAASDAGNPGKLCLQKKFYHNQPLQKLRHTENVSVTSFIATDAAVVETDNMSESCSNEFVYAAIEEPTSAMLAAAMPAACRPINYGPSTSQSTIIAGLSLDDGPSISFEELLLASVKYPSVSTDEKQKMKRICEGAEVITGEEVLQRLKRLHKQKLNAVV